MARFLEALRKQHSPNGEPATPRQDRVRGTKGRVLATAATLLLAVPGVALATMGSSGGEGSQHITPPSGSPPPTHSTRVGGGEIQPAGYTGPDGWCLTVVPRYGGSPSSGDPLEAQPCDGSPNQKFDITEEQSGPPSRTTFFIRLQGRSLCIATDVVPNRRDTYTPRLRDSANGQNPFCVLDGEQSGPFWELSDGQESPRVVVVPKDLTRSSVTRHEVLFRRKSLAERPSSPDNPLFYLPPTVPIKSEPVNVV